MVAALPPTPARWFLRGGYHGSGRYPCSPNEERRAGCRAPSPPSQIPSQGRFGLRVTYRDGIPLKKLRRCEDTSARVGSSVQRCAHQLPPAPPCSPSAASGVQLIQAAHHSPSPHRSALQSAPTSSHQSRQMHKI